MGGVVCAREGGAPCVWEEEASLGVCVCVVQPPPPPTPKLRSPASSPRPVRQPPPPALFPLQLPSPPLPSPPRVCVWVGEKRRLGRCGWEAGRRLIGWVYRWGGRCVRGRATGGLSWVGLGGGVSGFL